MDYKLKNTNDEELWVYTEDGYCIIQSECSETHEGGALRKQPVAVFSERASLREDIGLANKSLKN